MILVELLREALIKQRDWYERAMKSLTSRGEVSDGLMFQWPQVKDAVTRALAATEPKSDDRERQMASMEELADLYGARIARDAALAHVQALRETLQAIESKTTSGPLQTLVRAALKATAPRKNDRS